MDTVDLAEGPVVNAGSPPRAAGLKELLAKRNELSGTGHYFGLSELTVKDADPTRYERFYSALLVGLFSAREVSKFVSASPGSREMGELLFGLLAPEGDPVGISQGLAGNVAPFPLGVRWMIEADYETNPGISPGDIFSGDDPMTMGAVHPGDCFTYLPIFYEDQLVAWATGMNHIVEVGAVLGGSWPPFSPDTFTDGFVFPLLKTGEKYEYHAWWLELWKRRTRAPTFNILDEKMRLSGCQMIERKVKEVIDEFGLEYWREAIREIIEDGRRVVERNVRSLVVPGRARNAIFRTAGYEGVGVIFPLADKEYVIHVPVETQVQAQAGMHVDLAGASPWGFHAYNGYKGGAPAAVYLSAMDSVAHNAKINQGLMEQVSLHVDEGSVYAPDYDYASASNPWASTAAVLSAAINNTARSFLARGYVEECWTGEASWDGVQGSGILPNGMGWGFTNLQFVGAAGTGAFAYKDGMPTAWTAWNQRADIGNAEEWEFVTPALFYIGRKLVREFCAHGKYRGAVGHSATYVVLDPGSLAVNRGGGAMARGTTIAVGMSGGYPGPGVFVKTYHATNMRELMERSEPYPTSPLELDEFVDDGRLKVERVTRWKSDTPPIEMKDGDLYTHAAGAGGGWGDPIERDPDLGLADVRDGFVGRDTVRDVYAVVLTDNEQSPQVDQAATAQARDDVRSARARRGRPVSEWWAEQRRRVQSADFLPVVAEMHRGCLGFEKYRTEFTGFWQLPDDAVLVDKERDS